MSTKRVRSEKKERQVKRRRVEPLIPSEVTAEVDVLKISALHRGNPEKYTKEVIRRHLNNLWPYQSYRGEKSLWDIVQELGAEAETLQEIFDKERNDGPSDCIHEEEDHLCDDDCNDPNNDECGCLNCDELNYYEAFPDSVNFCAYYDMENDKVLGPFSLSCLGVSKKQLEDLHRDDSSTRRAIKDLKQMNLLDANKSVVCIFSK
jgi:hypothetical protein